jgi:hypothetical protein
VIVGRAHRDKSTGFIFNKMQCALRVAFKCIGAE